MVKPSQWLEAALAGRIAPDEAPDAVRSWLRLVTFTKAEEILKLPAEQRKAAAEKYPEAVRDLIREDCKRLLKPRK